MSKFSSPVFRGLAEAEILQIQNKCMRSAEYAKGSTILHAGDITQEMGIVESGSVLIENIDLWGNKSILSNISEGQVFAETYALSNKPLMVDAVAAESSVIMFLNMGLALKADPTESPWSLKLMSNLLELTAQKNITLSQRIFCTSAKTIRARLLTYLSAVSVQSGSTTFEIPFDRQQLAEYLNLDRSALSKELGRMRDDGLIDFHKNSFKLKNM